MVRVALLVGIALALVVQVFANNGAAVNEIMNSTDSAYHNNLLINHFLTPDSKVASTLQGSLLKAKELETAPTCNKLASAALIYTCATSEDDKDAPESTENTLVGEKTLFAARFAVCELSDSADRSLVPAECAIFILTETNTKQKCWWGCGTAKGRDKPLARYPEYDQATRQHRDRCVKALQSSPVTGISYSNAKQTAHQWCSIARVDIENGKLLEMHRAFAESWAHQDDVLRSQTETMQQNMEATEFLRKQLRIFAQNTMDTHDALREVLTDARETINNLVEDMGVQLKAKLEQYMAADEAHDASRKAKFDKLVSEIMDFTTQHSTDLSLARRNDAEEFSGRMSYVLELVEQRMIQLSSDVDSTSREVAVRGSEMLGFLQLVNDQLFGANELARRNFEAMSNMTGTIQEMQDQYENLSAKFENSEKVAATLESKLLAMSDMASLFAGFTDFILAAAWCCLYFIGVVTCLLFLCLGGWSILTLATASILNLLRTTFNDLKELAQVVLLAAGNTLSSLMSVMQQCVDWKGALLLILSVAGIAFYSVAVETPAAYWQRLENGGLSLFEPANCIALALILLVFLCAISRPALAVRESGILQSGGYECYDDKECAV